MTDLKEFDAPDFGHSTSRLDRPSPYLLNKARRNDDGYTNLKKAMSSSTIYIGGLTFTTTEEQLFEMFTGCGAIKQIIMGLDKKKLTPTGFCFVIFEKPQGALNAIRYMNKMKVNGRIITIDLDPGFEEGRQFGRGLDGGQKQRTFTRKRRRIRRFRPREGYDTYYGGRERSDDYRNEDSGSYGRERGAGGENNDQSAFSRGMPVDNDRYHGERREYERRDYYHDSRRDFRPRYNDRYEPNGPRDDQYGNQGGYGGRGDYRENYGGNYRNNYRDDYQGNYRERYQEDYKNARPHRSGYVAERPPNGFDTYVPENGNPEDADEYHPDEPKGDLPPHMQPHGN